MMTGGQIGWWRWLRIRNDYTAHRHLVRSRMKTRRRAAVVAEHRHECTVTDVDDAVHAKVDVTADLVGIRRVRTYAVSRIAGTRGVARVERRAHLGTTTHADATLARIADGTCIAVVARCPGGLRRA